MRALHPQSSYGMFHICTTILRQTCILTILVTFILLTPEPCLPDEMLRNSETGLDLGASLRRVNIDSNQSYYQTDKHGMSLNFAKIRSKISHENLEV